MFLMVCKGLFYTIAVDIYTYCLVFCRISHCVLMQNALRFAPNCTAFCTKLHCILRQNAANLAKNGPKAGANCGFMQCVFILPAFTTNPFLHQNKPSRESIFCGKVGDWWTERALIMLKFLLKTVQKCLRGIRAYGQLRGKHARLQPPAKAVVGHADHSQRKQHHENAEISCH